MSVALACFIYFVAAGVAWQFNNPLGNQLTFWRHVGSAMQFKALLQYQEKP